MRHLWYASILTACLVPLQCATLERLSLDDLIVKSTAIVRGTVVESHAVASRTDVFTHYTVQVAETLKGTAGGKVDVVVPGGVAGNVRQSIPGAPSLTAGGNYVLFLWTGSSGVTQVIGFTQGLFALTADATGDPVATRDASRELMLDGRTGRPVKDEALVMRLSDLRARISTTLGAAKAK